MKKIALLFCAAALVLVSCGGHTLCPAYTSVKKVQDTNKAMAEKHNKVLPS